MTGFPKPSRTARKIEKKATRQTRTKAETDNKATAKKRDGWRCRFPLCGCRSLGLALDARLESSHDRHKGAGGNPTGDRSLPAGLMSLCLHRHQDGHVSRHKGTLRAVYLTKAGSDGPVAWELHAPTMRKHFKGIALPGRAEWVEVARETKVQALEPLVQWQIDALEKLAEMKH